VAGAGLAPTHLDFHCLADGGRMPEAVPAVAVAPAPGRRRRPVASLALALPVMNLEMTVPNPALQRVDAAAIGDCRFLAGVAGPGLNGPSTVRAVAQSCLPCWFPPWNAG
jgi:hypothetical protein